MNLPRFPSVSGSSSNSNSNVDPYDEFRFLAEDFRKRRALVHNNSKHDKPPGTTTCSRDLYKDTATRLQPVSCESSSPTTSTLLPPPHDATIRPQHSRLIDVVTEQSDSLLRAATAVYGGEDTGTKSGRSTPKKRNSQRSSSSGRTHSSQQNTASRHHHHRRQTRSAGVFDEEDKDSGGGGGGSSRLDPRVEAAMLKVFGRDSNRGGGCPAGVSVSAIRSLYRKRHEREKAAALSEVRRWWKLSSSGMTTAFVEATAAAALLLTPADNRGGDEASVLRDTHCGLNNNNRPESDDLSQIGNVARGYRTLDSWGKMETSATRTTGDRVVDGRTIATNDTTSMNGKSARDHHHHHHRNMRETRVAADDNNDHLAPSSIFDNLNWRDVLLNDSYRDGLVRDMKRALRAGRKVTMRAEEDDSLGGGRCSRGDCQLMLRTLYMQSVQVTAFSS